MKSDTSRVLSFSAIATLDDLRLTPKRPYNAFRIQFLDSSNSTAIAASGIAFKVCQDSMCKRAIGRKAMIVGGKVPKRCPFDTYGQKYLVCGRDDVAPAWIKDKAMCLKKYSPKGVAFIDTGYHFEGMRVEKIENNERVSQREIPEHLTVWKDQITFPMLLRGKVIPFLWMRFCTLLWRKRLEDMWTRRWLLMRMCMHRI